LIIYKAPLRDSEAFPTQASTVTRSIVLKKKWVDEKKVGGRALHILSENFLMTFFTSKRNAFYEPKIYK